MTTSNIQSVDNLYVWVWLPGSSEPVVAGQIVKQNNMYRFTYGQRYRELDLAIPFSPFELPLQKGSFTPHGQNLIHSCFRDAAPDYWGRYVIDYHYPGLRLNELDYLLLSDSNRCGALDFQISSTEYIDRTIKQISIDNILSAATKIERHQTLPPELDFVLMQGSSMGGAQPKATMNWENQEWLVKFASVDDSVDVAKLEYITMRLAELAGLHVAQVKFESCEEQGVLLVQRFDRHTTNTVIPVMSRNFILSGYSLLGLTENEAQYASYVSIADVVRREFFKPKLALEEIFKRLAFNILVGNTDDGINHLCAIWDGTQLNLSPAFGLCPQQQFEQKAKQVLAINGRFGNEVSLRNISSIAGIFQVSNTRASDIIGGIISVIKQNWSGLCDEVNLNEHTSRQFWNKIVLAPHCINDWHQKASNKIKQAH
ncbi:MAG: type II toxin-antitoxin system HipA family toxin [Thiohalomonadales bacterium]